MPTLPCVVTRRRARATSLVEILVAVTFLAICASVILRTVLTADTQGAYALRRARVLSALQDQIETVRGSAASGSLTGGTTTQTLTLPGFTGPVTTTTTLTLRTTSRTLWDITVTAAWSEEASRRTWNDAASLTTLVRD